MENFCGELNLDFYDLSSIEEAIDDFREVSEISFDKISGRLKVLSTDEEMNSEEVYREFYNYVLGVMKNRKII